ncbi:MAG: hypothetical protein ACE366_11680 [Bradymonadia bacterium]
MKPQLLLALVLLTGCRDSPIEVIEGASIAAADGDQSNFRSYFSNGTVQRLRRKWALTGETPEAHWRRLAEGLTFGQRSFAEDGVKFAGEAIHGEYAEVTVSLGAESRSYYLRKEDGAWRIDLGAGQRYRLAAPSTSPDAGAKKSQE